MDSECAFNIFVILFVIYFCNPVWQAYVRGKKTCPQRHTTPTNKQDEILTKNTTLLHDNVEETVKNE